MATPRNHPSLLDKIQLLRQCSVTRTRRSGPGGQNRNKVETAIVLVHHPTGTIAEANERRSQQENLTEAIFRLRVTLALEVRGNGAETGLPSELWRQRCQKQKISVNPKHADFPSLLAEALDFLASGGMDLSAVAIQLGCSSSQLTKFLKLEPRALLIVNRHRASLGRSLLK